MQKTTNEIIIFLLATTLLVLFMGAFVVTILFLYRKKHVTYLRELEQIKINHEKSILNTKLEIQEQTFQTISREIHDNITLTLTLAKLNLNTINLCDRIKSLSLINNTTEFVSKAIEDLTDISRTMNSDIVVEHGLITALQKEIDKINHLNWFHIQFEIQGAPVFMDSHTELFVYRILQEAFNNILKHSHAKNVKLNLLFSDESLSIDIEDDGVGFNNKSDKSEKKVTAGLTNMRKRAELLNGCFEMLSHPGSGTKIIITIPINQ